MLENPFAQFAVWYQEAAEHPDIIDHTAMTLATVDKEHKPSARIVLLKDFNEQGFSFFTNYLSRKGDEIGQNPNVALLFWWPQLEKQIRIEGKAVKVSATESDRYFQSRPRGSQLSAWASEQSMVIADREHLEQRLAEFEDKFGEGLIERPSHWGGYLVKPECIEFWQARAHRLHDRFQFKLHDDVWQMQRLAP